MTEEGRRRLSEAGKVKDKRKGFGSMDKERLRQISSMAGKKSKRGKKDESQQSQQLKKNQ